MSDAIIIDSKKLEKYFNNPAHINILSSADREGTPNLAIFASTRLIGEQIVIGCGDNRSLKNLRQNPKAALLITIPGDSILAYQGLRLYLQCCAIDEDSALLESIRNEVRETAGRTAARMVQYLLRFDIIETRDLVDLSTLFATK